MKRVGDGFRLAATDLSNHIACAHLTSLSLANAAGRIEGGYTNFDPALKILRERGEAHEKAYLAHLKSTGRRVESGGERTRAWMEEGIEVIAQAALEVGRWYGRADFLVRVERPSAQWPWSYEVTDTKLSTETRAGTVLQLCVYSDLLAVIQGTPPVAMHVVKPGEAFPIESFRYEEYSAIYRSLRTDLEARAEAGPEIATYPEYTTHCETCNWRTRCETQRRADDDLSFVVGLGRGHQRELERHDIRTLTALSNVASPWPYKPDRGAVSTYERLRNQARLQHAARALDVPPYELLPIEPERGLNLLPEPSRGDLFLDFEGDPYIGAYGREYLFGWWTEDRGYECIWAVDDVSERDALGTFIRLVMERWRAHPDMHVYHYGSYEQTALKRLVGRYAICSGDLDRLLHGRRLVDLHALARQTARIGVESYSIKCLEKLVGYVRAIALDETSPHVRAATAALQRGFGKAIEPASSHAVEAYNRGDCESAAALRAWLETRRSELVAAGADLRRPPLLTGEREATGEVARAAEVTSIRLLSGVGHDRDERSDLQQAQWLLAHLMEWYRREDSATWWEFFRLADMSDEDRLDDLRAISGLRHVTRIGGKARTLPVDRYEFPPQDALVREGDELYVDDDPQRRLGTVVTIDPLGCSIEIKKSKKMVDDHPSSFFVHPVILPRPKDSALLEIGNSVAEHGFVPPDRASLARDLLARALPRGLTTTGVPLRRDGEATEACALRLALALDGTVLPIQGPPGTGKTSTAARMIVALLREGRKIGVTATSHAVIENLVSRAVRLARQDGVSVRAALKCDEPDGTHEEGVEYIGSAQVAAARMADLDLLGATAWQWAREDMRSSVDVLFIDEAGQLSLADGVAVTGSARSLVLVGDPQQLEQPILGRHPDHVAVSVLQHMLGDAQTIPADRGLFLDQTHRLHPAIAAFTSEQFYERRLTAGPSVDSQQIVTRSLMGPGLYWCPVPHTGNVNRSTEEAAAIASLIESCLDGGSWSASGATQQPLTERDVLVVAPYNAQLAAIRDALATRGLRGIMVGTVDKFQGREAAIAIYSMATSRPEDAPRGLAFLYDRHRLNVATSRARCASIVVANPSLLRPVLVTPEHLHLASALARFVELAKPLDVAQPTSSRPPSA